MQFVYCSRGVIKTDKNKKVSILVWVCLKGMLLKNTLKEKWTTNNHYNDHYNYYSGGYPKH